MANNVKTFKISDLDEIDIHDIDDNDSFLITDYNKNKLLTKRISMKKLMKVIVENPTLIQQILSDDEFEQSLETKVVDKVDKVMDITTIDGGNAFRNDS